MREAPPLKPWQLLLLAAWLLCLTALATVERLAANDAEHPPLPPPATERRQRLEITGEVRIVPGTCPAQAEDPVATGQ